MKEREESGLSIKSFCKNAGIHANSYFYWQRKLRESVCEQLIKKPTETTSLMAPNFVEVKLSVSASHKCPQTAEPDYPQTAEKYVHKLRAGISDIIPLKGGYIMVINKSYRLEEQDGLFFCHNKGNESLPDMSGGAAPEGH